MSAEFAMRMEVLRYKREELTARRVAIEKKIALREATATEFSAVALQSYKHKWKRLRTAAVAAKARNDEFIRSLHVTQQKANEAFLKHKNDLTSSSALLEQEKVRYFQKIEAIYPAWQEQLQNARLQKLKTLEEKKRVVEKRRYLAKKTFEKERSLDDLIQQTSHEIELSESLEKNEAYERELLRRQSTVQATRLDYTIREHARGARSFMAQQAQEHIREAAEIDDQVAEYEEKQEIPQRSINIELPRASTRHEEQGPRQHSANIEILRAAQHHFVSANNNFNQPEHQVFTDPKKSPSPLSLHIETNQGDREHRGLQEPVIKEQLAVIATSVAPDNCDDISRSEPVVASPVLEATQQPSAAERLQNQIETTATQRAPDVMFSSLKSSGPVSAIIRSELEQFPPTSEHTQPPSENQTPNLQLVSEETRASASVKPPMEALAAQPDTMGIEVASPILSQGQLDTLSQREPEVDHSLPNDNQSPNFTVSDAKSEDFAHSTEAKLSAESGVPHREMRSSEHHAHTTSRQAGEPDYSSFTKVGSVQDSFGGLSDSVTSDGKPTLHGDTFARGGFSPLGPEQKIDLALNIVNSFDSNASSTTMNSVTHESQFQKEEAVAEPVVQPQAISTANSSPQTVVDSVESLEVSNSFAKADHYLSSSSATGWSLPTVRADANPTVNFNAASDSVLEAKQELNEQAYQSDTNTQFPATTRELSELARQSAPVEGTESEAPKTVVAAVAEEKPIDEQKKVSLIEKLSMADKLKVLGALITRIEEGAAEGDPFSASIADDGSTADTKRELVRMAAGGRKAQINFFGSDICFELVVDIAKELGPVLFPARAFEGIMSEQKIKKVHQNSKDKELALTPVSTIVPDLWKVLSSHMKQMVALKALPVSAVAELFGKVFLHHDPTNQRSQRKMKELLFSVCGATVSSVSSKKENVGSSSPSSNRGYQQPRDDEYETSSPGTGKQPQQQQAQEQSQAPRFETPSLLQTAFLQHTSPAKPKSFGLGSSGFKKKSDSQDVLKSMASSSPAKLSHKLMRGGKMRDYSEFEEEEEVDLQNLIGSKGKSALSTTGGSVASSPSSMGGSYKSPPHSGAASASAAASNRGRAAKEDNDFDVDF